MGAQQSDPASDCTGPPAARRVVLGWGTVECLGQVGVAKSVDEELGATDRAQQIEVIRRPRVQGTCTTAVPGHGSADVGSQRTEWRSVFTRCQRIEIAIVDQSRAPSIRASPSMRARSTRSRPTSVHPGSCIAYRPAFRPDSTEPPRAEQDQRRDDEQYWLTTIMIM